MREITEHTDQTIQAEILHPAVERFILHWGEMGGQWGVNRSVSQIHALLYISEHPRTAEEIAFVLGIARSNVSNSLKELLAWDLIRRVPVRGDRREHFEAEADVWELVSRIAAGRKAREIDPALAVLRSCVADFDGDQDINPVAAKRLKEMLSFTETIDTWYAQMLHVPKAKLAGLLRLGAKIIKFVPTRKSKTNADKTNDNI
ncbi:MAG: DNA-binding transcriptional regulator GbsR (MarR family) [Alphaproteobacteria bacterium]|jgi:DNA-binding transcriptional regulator GbsR (MarR family)